MSIPADKFTIPIYKDYDKMSVIMDNDFPRWLIEQRKARGWSQADLHRAAKISRQVISDYEGYKRQFYDDEILKKIAKAFKLPVETVYRAAGKLPPKSERQELIEQINYIFDNLSPEEQENVIEYAELRRRLAEEKASYQSKQGKTKPRPATAEE